MMARCSPPGDWNRPVGQVAEGVLAADRAANRKVSMFDDSSRCDYKRNRNSDKINRS
jgi:hypothetical protein